MTRPSPTPQARPMAPLVVGWLVFGLVELSLAALGALRPSALQIAFELVGLTIVGCAHARLARSSLLRSPTWIAALPVWSVLLVFGPPGVADRILSLAGALALAILVAKLWARWLPTGVWVAAAFGVLGAVAGRVLVLERAPVPTGWATLVEQLRHLGSDASPAPRPEAPPLVVISVDTLRRDAAQTMNSHRRLAARGATWTGAMTTASWTLPALASLQTGLMPGGHGAGVQPAWQFQGLAPEVTPLAVRLQDAGYTTAAFVAQPWVTREMGFDAGFGTFHNTVLSFPHRLMLAGFPRGPSPWDCETVVTRALDWLAGAPPGGFYLWVHLFDPHLPYLHATEGSLLQGFGDAFDQRGLWFTPELRDQVRAAYAVEVDHTDRCLTRLLDALEAEGVLDRGAVVLTADHGEEFWEHGEAGHGWHHHGEVMDVPLVLTAPGLAPGPRPGVASLVDVAPTLLSVAGLDADGIDLRQGVPEGRVATAYGNLHVEMDRSARDATGRVLMWGLSGEVARYDLVVDPAEQVPLPVDLADPLRREAAATAAPGLGAPADIHEEALRALGYVD